MKEYKYDAFISYRHVEPDQTIAKWIHGELENFKLPRKIVKKHKEEGKRTKVSRVFRDQEELPLAKNLEDPIIEALKESEWLIVICSKELGKSEWCKKEIETFIGLHGYDNILTVIVDGEPDEVIPDILKKTVTEETKFLPKDEQVFKTIEPLAADFRGNDKKKHKVEIMRLLAPMFGLDFDDIKQRHREQRLKKIVRWSVIIAILAITVGAFSFITMLQIQKQNEEIERQSEEISNKMQEISVMAADIEQKNKKLTENQAINLANDALEALERDDRELAKEYAVASLTEYDGVEMPYTSAGQYALFESIYPYDFGNILREKIKMQTQGYIIDYWITNDNKYAVTYDSSCTISYWDAVNNVLIGSSRVDGKEFLEANVSNTNKFVYIADDKILIADIATATVENYFDIETRTHFYICGDDIYVTKNNYNTDDFTYTGIVEVYDHKDLKKKNEHLVDGMRIKKLFDIDDDYFAISVDTSDPVYEEIYVVNKETGTVAELYSDSDIGSIKNIVSDENAFYLVYAEPLKLEDITSIAYQNLVAIDKESLKAKWKNNIANEYVVALDFIDNNAGDNCLIQFTDNEVAIIDKDTGSIKNSLRTDYMYAEHIIKDNIVNEFTKNGDYLMFQPDGDSVYVVPQRWRCTLGNISRITYMDGDIYVLLTNDNNLYRYSEADFESVVFAEEPMDVPVQEKYSNETEILELTDKYGIELSPLVKSAVIVPDDKLLFLCNSIGDVELYDLDNKNMLASWKVDTDFDQYLGKDKADNIYFSTKGFSPEGYVVNKEYNIIAKINYLSGVNKETNTIGMTYYNQYFEAPIYSFEELLEMAK